MKKTLFALGIAMLLTWAPKIAKADVSVDFFYDNLNGGNWVEVGDYGYCWQPDVAVGNSAWRPYSDGYWAYTDDGWTWVSYEDFGWATYHYGRWTLLNDYGWVWVPGRNEDLEWGPAWVSWRTGGDYIGWAPLPPETIAVVESRPITGHIDVEFNIGPVWYNFVETRYIGEPVLRERIIAPTQNVTYIQQTVNVTNITYNNRTVYNYGPDINVVNRTAARPIQRLRLDREQNVDVATAAKSGNLTKVQGDRLVVAAPMRITKSASQAAPSRVKAKVAAGRVDRGWSVVGDDKAQAEFKNRIKSQNLKSVPPATGTGATAQTGAPASASPNANPTANAAGQTQTGQSRQGAEHGQIRDRGGRDAAAAAVSPASSPAASSSPAQAADQNVANQGPGHGQGRRGPKYPPHTNQQNAGGVLSNEATGAPTGGAAGSGLNTQTEDQDQSRGGRQPEQRRVGRFQNQPGSNNPGTTSPPEHNEQGLGAGGRGRRGADQNQSPQSGQPAVESTPMRQGQGRHGQNGEGQVHGRGQGQGQGQDEGRRGGKHGQPEGSPSPQ